MHTMLGLRATPTAPSSSAKPSQRAGKPACNIHHIQYQSPLLELMHRDVLAGPTVSAKATGLQGTSR